MPLALFRLRNVATANVVGVLWAAAMFAWFFLSALYLQLVLGYSPLQVGLAFLPANLIMGAFSLGLSAKLVMRFGIRPPLRSGWLLAAAGLALFARAPVDGTSSSTCCPSMLLLGLGAGMAFNPLLLAAMSDVAPEESGLASGVVNTAFMMGGALGLAVLASLAASRTTACVRPAAAPLAALNRRLPRRPSWSAPCSPCWPPYSAGRSFAPDSTRPSTSVKERSVRRPALRPARRLDAPSSSDDERVRSGGFLLSFA